jgi:hypothetical protein
MLRPRMIFLMHGPEAVLIDMGINLRGADVAVTEQFLDDAQVRPAADEMGGEAVGATLRDGNILGEADSAYLAKKA